MSIDKTDLNLETALNYLVTNKAKVLSGGTDYYPGLNDAEPDSQLLNIRRIAGLNSLSLKDGYWRIGAAVTWSALINATLPPCFNCLKQAGTEVGSVQIQNAATLVGNICNASPAADGVPALLVLDAQVELSSIDGVRVVPLAEFIVGVRKTVLLDNELVTALLIPETRQNDYTDFVKLGSRTYLVISIVMCAVRLRVNATNTITDAAIAVGACSPVACRLPELEQALIGLSCESETLRDCVSPAHLQSLVPITDVRATAQYRIQAAQVLLQRQLSAFAQQIAVASTAASTATSTVVNTEVKHDKQLRK